MTFEERIKRCLDDIKTSKDTKDMFNDTELEYLEESNTGTLVFKSWEYYNIFYFLNVELYYLNGETERALIEASDDVYDTDRGRIYCLK